MLETEKLLTVLKKLLRENGFTYLDVAEHLNLSEASVKRMFAKNHITLKRLEQICKLLDMDIESLVSELQKAKNYLQKLTEEQESLLVSDTKLFLVSVSVLNRMSYQKMFQELTLTEKELNFYLKKLASFGLIRILPNNVIRLLVAHNFNWIPGGPIQLYFRKNLLPEYFDCDFHNPNEKFQLVNAALSNQSNALIQHQIDRLVQLIVDLEHKDQSLPAEQKTGTTLVTAIRPWWLKQFSTYRKN